jgi:hypothetical protein
MQDLLERLAAILELPAETVERHILMLLVPLVREMHEAEVEEDARKDALAEREAGWLRRAIARAKLRRLAPP